MKPLKSGIAFANWLLKFALAFFVSAMFAGEILAFNYNTLQFYFAAAFVLLSILLIIGSFFTKSGITVVSGFLLTSLAIYKIFENFAGELNLTIASFFVILAFGFYFVCAGNNK